MWALHVSLVSDVVSSDTAVSDGFRYVFSPGTMLALRLGRVEPSHRGVGVFIDALNWYGRAMSFALVVNAILYGLLIFGIVTTLSAIKAETRKLCRNRNPRPCPSLLRVRRANPRLSRCPSSHQPGILFTIFPVD